MTHQEDAVNDTLLERDRQDRTFGEQNHHPAYWLALLGKQMGQLGDAIVKREWATDDRRALARMRNEAIQLTAVGLCFIECIDRGKMPATMTDAVPSNPRQKAVALGIGHEQMNYGGDDD